MLKKLLFLCVFVFIFAFTGVAGATLLCHRSVCPDNSNFKIWHGVDYIYDSVSKDDPARFEFDITPTYNPTYDTIHSAWMKFYFKGTANEWFLGKYVFDGGGIQWETVHTNTFGRALEWESLWGDPLETLRTTGMLSGDFIARLCGNKELKLKKAFLYAKGCDNPVPEPATLLLLGSGLVAIAGFGRKKFRNKTKK
jgi:hypothetical protein